MAKSKKENAPLPEGAQPVDCRFCGVETNTVEAKPLAVNVLLRAEGDGPDKSRNAEGLACPACYAAAHDMVLVPPYRMVLGRAGQGVAVPADPAQEPSAPEGGE